MTMQKTCAQCGKEGAVLFERQGHKLPLCKDLSCMEEDKRGYYTKLNKD